MCAGDALGLLANRGHHVLGDDLLLVAHCTGAGAGGVGDGVLADGTRLSAGVVAGDLAAGNRCWRASVHAHLASREDDFVAGARQHVTVAWATLKFMTSAEQMEKERFALGILPRKVLSPIV